MVLHLHAAVDIENLAGDIAGVVGGQELYGVGYSGPFPAAPVQSGSQLFTGLGVNVSIIAVSMNPGVTALTVILRV